MTNSLFGQLNDQRELREAAAALCGIFEDINRFDSALHDIAPLPPGFHVSDIARAYLRFKLHELGDFGTQVRVGDLNDSREQSLLIELLSRRGFTPSLCVNSDGAPRGVSIPHTEVPRLRVLQDAQPDLFRS